MKGTGSLRAVPSAPITPTRLRQVLELLGRCVAAAPARHERLVGIALSTALDRARASEEQDICVHPERLVRHISGVDFEECAICRKCFGILRKPDV